MNECVAIVNGIADDNKFRLFVTRIAEKCDSQEVFTMEELQKLTSVLQIEQPSKINEIVCYLKNVFNDCVYNVCKPKTFANELKRSGFSDQKVAVMSQVWLSHGSTLIERRKSESFSLSENQLTNVNWKVGVQCNSDVRSEMNTMKAQLDLIFNEKGDADERKVSLEFNHSELSALYSQLECIQTKIDTLLK